MADRVLPIVRKLMVCREALWRSDDETNNVWKWQLTQPLSVVWFPPGVKGNFDLKNLWVYGQFAGAVGKFDLFLKMQLIELNPATGAEFVRKEINIKRDTVHLDFENFHPLEPRDYTFEMAMVPFDVPGTYRFSVWTIFYTENSDHLQLPGETADLVVLDGSEGL